MSLFNAAFKVDPGWLTAIWEAGKGILEDISDQLRGCGLDMKSPPITNSEIESLENYIKAHREHPRFGDRQSLIAEYWRVVNLCRYAIAETPSTALSYAESIRHKDASQAAERLSQRSGFRNISHLLKDAKKLHPKISKVRELAERLVDQQVLVVCHHRKSIGALSRAIGPYFHKVYQWDSKVKAKQLEEELISFNCVPYGALAVATITLGTNRGLIADSAIAYHCPSADWAYVKRLLPLPRIQSIVVAVDHELDLGRSFWRPDAERINKLTAATRRRRRGKAPTTGTLDF